MSDSRGVIADSGTAEEKEKEKDEREERTEQLRAAGDTLPAGAVRWDQWPSGLSPSRSPFSRVCGKLS